LLRGARFRSTQSRRFARLGTKAVQIFVEALATGEIRGRLRQAGFVPAISGDATECE
jgi:hypothetical protein